MNFAKCCSKSDKTDERFRFFFGVTQTVLQGVNLFVHLNFNLSLMFTIMKAHWAYIFNLNAIFGFSIMT